MKLKSGFSKEAVALSLSKKDKPDYYAFDDGVMIQFETSKPKHISFYCMTESTNLASQEVCDLRLFKNDLTTANI